MLLILFIFCTMIFQKIICPEYLLFRVGYSGSCISHIQFKIWQSEISIFLTEAPRFVCQIGISGLLRIFTPHYNFPFELTTQFHIACFLRVFQIILSNENVVSYSHDLIAFMPPLPRNMFYL